MQKAHADVIGASASEAGARATDRATEPMVVLGREGNLLRVETLAVLNTPLNGLPNTAPRQALTSAIIEAEGDQFDFIFALATFPVELSVADLIAKGLYWQISNDTGGIGLNLYDNSAPWGSPGRLQGYIDLGMASPQRLNAGSFEYQFLLETAAHELMHRWSSYVRYRDLSGTVRDDLLGHLDSHWNSLVDNGASVMYGHDWREIEAGVFESGQVRRRYSELDLYLAGMLQPSAVSPLALLRTSAPDIPLLPQAGLQVSAEVESIDLSQIIDFEGPREPSVAASQKHFRAALVLLSRPGESIDPGLLAAIEHFRRDVQQRFSFMTNGAGILHIFPGNGLGGSVGVPQSIAGSDWTSTTMVDSDAALDWLENSQGGDGFWTDRAGSRWRDTALAIRIFSLMRPGSPALASGVDGILDEAGTLVETTAWARIAQRELPVDEAVIEGITAARNPDGGWGLTEQHRSSVEDTARILMAFWTDLEPELVEAGMQFLASRQNGDGSWGSHLGGGAHFPPTLSALEALSLPVADLGASLESGLSWLQSVHRPDGAFRHEGREFSVGDTARALALLIGRGASAGALNATTQWLALRQGQDGDWGGSAFATAATLRTLGLMQSPNLAIAGLPESVPGSPVAGSPVELSVRVVNNGQELAPASTLRWYLGDPAGSGTPISSALSVPELAAGSSVLVNHVWTGTDIPGTTELQVVVDEDETIDEWTRQDNSARLELEVRPAPEGIDLALHSSALSISPPSINSVPADVRVTGTLWNFGLSNATGGELVLFDNGALPPEVLATTQVDVPARGQIAFELDFVHDGSQSGELLLAADPGGLLIDADRSNNELKFALQVVSGIDIELTSIELLPEGATHAGRTLEVAVDLSNRGLSPAPPFSLQVEIIADDALVHDVETELSLDGQTTVRRTFPWVPEASGIFTIRASADPDASLGDVDPLNNVLERDVAITELEGVNLLIEPLSLNQEPIPALEGSSYQVSASIRSDGGDVASGFDMALYDGDPRDGAQLLGQNRHAGDLAPGESAIVPILIDGFPLRGVHTLWLKADAGDEHIEADELDNLFTYEINSLSLPDLFVQPADLSFAPETPVSGETVVLESRVHNGGQQPARNVLVELFEIGAGGQMLIESRIIDEIAPDSFEMLDWVWDFGVTDDTDQILLRVNSDSNVVEQQEGNNEAALSVVTDGGPLFASNPVFSPNADGIKDDTLIVFRLAEPVIGELVIEREGELVRQLSQAGEAPTDRGQVRWDGKNELGRVVPDGDYQVRLQQQGGLIATTMVTVDNDRPALAAAHNHGRIFRNFVPGFSADHAAPVATEFEGVGAGLVLLNPFSNELEANLSGVFRTGINVLEPIISGRWIDQRSAQVGGPLFALHASFDPERSTLAVIAGDREEFYRANTFELWITRVDQVDDVVAFPLSTTSMPLPIGFSASGEFTLLLEPNQGESRIANASRTAVDIQYSEPFISPQVDSDDLDSGFSFAIALHDGVLIKQANDGLAYVAFGAAVVNLAQLEIIDWAWFDRSVFGSRAAVHLVTRNSEEIWWFDEQDRSVRQVTAIEREFPLNPGLLCSRLGDHHDPGSSLEFDHLQLGMAWSPREDLLAIADAAGHRLLLASNESEQAISLPGIERPDYQQEIEIQIAEGGIGVPEGSSRSLALQRVAPSIQRIASEFQEFGPLNFQCSSNIGDSRAPDNADQSDSRATGETRTGSINTLDRAGLLNLRGRHGVRWAEDGTRLMFVQSDAIITDEQAEHLAGIISPGIAHRVEYDLLTDAVSVSELEATSLWPYTGQASSAPLPIAASPHDSTLVFDEDRNLRRRGWWWSGGKVEGWLESDPQFFISRIWPAQAGYLLTVRESEQDNPDLPDLPVPVLNLDRPTGILISVALRESIDLGGFATDRNFARWRIDVAADDGDAPWQQVLSWNHEPVVNARFLRWPPDTSGPILLRLTLDDHGGNRHQTFRRVIVPFEPVDPILELTDAGPRIISPNGDGIQDRVQFDYTAIRAEPFELRVIDAFGNLVYDQVISHLPDELGPRNLSWGGEMNSGLLAPDGEYRVEVWQFAVSVTVDTALPEVAIQPVIPPHIEKPPPPPREDRWPAQALIQADVTDELDVETVLEARPGTGRWFEFARPPNLYWISIGMNESEDYTRLEFRLRATDAAGNETIQPVPWPGDLLVVKGFVDKDGEYAPDPLTQSLFARVWEDFIPSSSSSAGVEEVLVDHTSGLVINYLDLSRDSVDDLRIELRIPGSDQWITHQVAPAPQRAGQVNLPFDLIPAPEFELRLASGQGGFVSNIYTVGLQLIDEPKCWNSRSPDFFSENVEDLVDPDSTLMFWQAFSAPEFNSRELFHVVSGQGPALLEPVASGRDGALAYAIPNAPPSGASVLYRVGLASGEVRSDQRSLQCAQQEPLGFRRPGCFELERHGAYFDNPIPVIDAAVNSLVFWKPEADVAFSAAELFRIDGATGDQPIEPVMVGAQDARLYILDRNVEYRSTYRETPEGDVSQENDPFECTDAPISPVQYRITPTAACGTTGGLLEVSLPFPVRNPDFPGYARVRSQLRTAGGTVLDELFDLESPELTDPAPDACPEPAAFARAETDLGNLPPGEYEVVTTLWTLDGERQDFKRPVPVYSSAPPFAIENPADQSLICLDESDPFDDRLDFSYRFLDPRAMAGVLAVEGHPDVVGSASGHIVKHPDSFPLVIDPESTGSCDVGVGSPYSPWVPFRAVPMQLIPIAQVGTFRLADFPPAPQVFNGQLDLEFNALDSAGGRACLTRRVLLDSRIELEGAAVEPRQRWSQRQTPVLTHNGAASLREIVFRTRAYEDLIGRMRVYPAEMELPGLLVPGDEPVFVDSASDIIGVLQPGVPPTDVEFNWTGETTTGDAADGFYFLMPSFEDACRVEQPLSKLVEVDSTGPVIEIASPIAGALVDTSLLEIRGRLEDKYFDRWSMSIGVGTAPSTWAEIAGGTRPISSVATLAVAQVAGLQGPGVIRVRAVDLPGNESELLIPVEFNTPPPLLNAFEVQPGLFGPIGNGVLDSAAILLDLEAEARVALSIRDIASDTRVRMLVDDSVLSPGSHVVEWDGLSDLGTVVDDGPYRVHVAAVATSDAGQLAETGQDVTVDTRLPEVRLVNPETEHHPGTGQMEVELLELHPESMHYELSSTTHGLIESATIEVSSPQTVLGLIDLGELDEGGYRVEFEATDRAANRANSEQSFIIDRTPPNVLLIEPADGRHLRPGETYPIQGLVDDEHLQRWTLSLALDEQDPEWMLLAESDQVPDSDTLLQWFSDLPDDAYLLRLRALDRAGNTNEQIHSIFVDGVAPTVEIQSPASMQWTGPSVEVRGTIDDSHLAGYSVFMVPADNDETQDGQAELAFGQQPIVDDIIGERDPGIAGGVYRLVTEAHDQAGNSAQAEVVINYTAGPPPAPEQLAVTIEQQVNVRLQWQVVDHPTPLAGFHVYRDGLLLNEEPVAPAFFIDENLEDGTYRYSVVAVDIVGNQSSPSATAVAVIRTSAPTVQITSPQSGERVRGIVEITGTAWAPDFFGSYRVSSFAPGFPETVIGQSQQPVTNGILVLWDTRALENETTVTLALEADDGLGNSARTERSVIVDNLAPLAPQGLTAEVMGEADVSLAWQPGGEADLLGYILFRNGGPVNWSGPLPADLRLLAFPEAAFLDAGVVDGSHVYRVFAIDIAGNLSPPSAPADAEIDRRPPSMQFVEPLPGQAFEQSIRITAISADEDIAEVEFAFRAQGEAVWQALAQPFSEGPYQFTWEPDQIPFGNYEITALATDLAGQVDPDPPVITVRFDDLTPPAVPAGLRATVDGAEITLDWNAVADDDLSGYFVYRYHSRINQEPLDALTFSETRGFIEEIDYRVSSVDENGNESHLSEPVRARIHRPLLEQPLTPTPFATTMLEASSVAAGMVSGQVQGAGQSNPLPALDVDDEASFIVPEVSLFEGSNIISLVIEDPAGNRSLPAEVDVLRSPLPEPPLDLVVDVIDDALSASWEPRSDPSVVGYRVYNNGNVMPEPEPAPDPVEADANVSDPWRVFSESTDEAWGDDYYHCCGIQPYIEVGFAGSVNISGLELDWLEGRHAVDYDVLAWSGDVWVPLHKQRGNQQLINVINVPFGYATDRIRIEILELTGFGLNRLGLVNLTLTAHPVLAESNWQSEVLLPGWYEVQVASVNTFGFEGPRSEPIRVSVGDVSVPSAVILSASVEGSDVILTWTENPGEPIDHYRVVRDGVEVASIAVDQNPEYRDVGLINGTYEYVVHAVSNASIESPPSNTVIAVIEREPPGKPFEVTVFAPPTGSALDLDWMPAVPAQPPAEYRVNRALAVDGPYAQIRVLAATSLRDSPLVNEVRYFYTVEALDAFGNSSGPSQPVSGIPRRIVAPDPPLFHHPGIAGEQIQVRRPVVSLFGAAEPGTSVEAFIEERLVGLGEAHRTPMLTELSGSNPSVDNHWTSPNGRWLWVVTDSGEFVHDTLAGSRVSVENTSPNGFNFTRHAFWDGRTGTFWQQLNSSPEPVVLDPETGTSEPLSLPLATTSLALPSPAGDRAVLTGGVVIGDPEAVYRWSRDEADSVELLTAVQPGQIQAGLAAWSPDGRFLAWVEHDGLRLLDVVNDQLEHYGDELLLVRPVWSPDSHRVAVHRGQVSDSRVWLVEADTGQLVAPPISDGHQVQPHWTRDGVQFSLVNDGWLQTYAAESFELQAEFALDAVPGLQSSRRLVGWLRSMELIVNVEDALYVLARPGWFHIADVELGAGENPVRAQALDDYGNLSLPSNPITLILGEDALPDLSVLVEPVDVFPLDARPGDSVVALFVVENVGSAPSPTATLFASLSQVDPALPVASRFFDIPPLAVGERVVLEWTLDDADQSAVYEVELRVDPFDEVPDATTANNLARHRFVISPDGAPGITVAVDSVQLRPGQPLTGQVSVTNSAQLFSGGVQLDIFDSAGQPVAALEASEIAGLAAGQTHEMPLSWDPGNVLAGNYRLQARLLDDFDQQLDQAVADFQIQIAAEVVLELEPVSPVVEAGTSAQIDLGLRVEQANGVIPGAMLDLVAMDPGGDSVAQWHRNLGTLLAGFDAAETIVWELDGVPTNTYGLRLDFTSSVLTRSTMASLAVIEDGQFNELTGEVAFAVVPLQIGRVPEVDWSVRAADTTGQELLPVRLRLIALPSGQTLDTIEFDLTLDPGQVLTGHNDLLAPIGQAGDFAVLLEARPDAGAEWRVLASRGTTALDATPPQIQIIEPGPGAVVRSPPLLRAAITDQESTVDHAEYRIGIDGLWLDLPLSVFGDYMAFIEPLADGPAEVTVRAADSAGNLAISSPREFIVDSTPPLISVTGITDGASVNQPVIPVIQIEETHPDSLLIVLDSQPFQSGEEISEPGLHRLEIEAVDQARNESRLAIEFEIDFTPPSVQFQAPEDGAVLVDSTTPAVLQTEPGATVLLTRGDFSAEATADETGVAVFESVPLEIGDNTMVAIARDRAGNESAPVARDVRWTPISDAIAGTILPAQSTFPVGEQLHGSIELHNPTDSNVPALEFLFQVRHPAIATPLAEWSGAANLPAGSTSSFEWSFTSIGWPTGELLLTLSIRDGAAMVEIDTTTVMLLDQTPPNVVLLAPNENQTVGPVVPILAEATDIHSEVALVEVSFDGIGWTPLTQDTGNADLFQGNLENLVEGSRQLRIRATDVPGNVSPEQSVAVESDLTPPVIQIEGVTDGLVTNEDVTPVITITGATAPVVEMQLNGEIFVNGTLIDEEGEYDLEIRAWDAVGNLSERAVEFTIDRTPPALWFTFPEPDARIADQTVLVTAFTESGAEVEVIGNLAKTTLFADPHGIVLIPDWPLAKGSNLVTARAQDRAGNASPESQLNLSSATTGFETLEASLDSNPDPVLPGQQLSVVVRVENTGGQDIVGLPLHLRLLDAAVPNGVALFETDLPVDIPAGGEWSGEVLVMTDQWHPGIVVASIEVADDSSPGSRVVLGASTVHVLPPVDELFMDGFESEQAANAGEVAQ